MVDRNQNNYRRLMALRVAWKKCRFLRDQFPIEPELITQEDYKHITLKVNEETFKQIVYFCSFRMLRISGNIPEISLYLKQSINKRLLSFPPRFAKNVARNFSKLLSSAAFYFPPFKPSSLDVPAKLSEISRGWKFDEAMSRYLGKARIILSYST